MSGPPSGPTVSAFFLAHDEFDMIEGCVAHYLLGVVEQLERDATRLQAAYACTNRNPLGSCAITGTGFQIDRHLTSNLLGFDGPTGNTYGSIATVDYLLDIVVTGDEPDQTRRVANAAAENLVRLSKEMATVDTSSPELVLVDAADPSVRQGSMWQFIVPAGAIGLAISCVLVLAYGLLRDKLYGKGHLDHVVDEALTREG